MIVRSCLWTVITTFLMLTATAQRKDSKYKGGVEMLKGLKFASLTFSTSSKNGKNENTPFVYYLDQKKSALTTRFDAGYLIKDNLGIGAGFLYGYKKNINRQQTPDGTITDFKSYEREFSFRPFVKNFLPLGNSKKFYIVVPTELQIGYGSRVTESTTNGILTRTFTGTNYYGIQMRPGLLAFLVDNFGVEVNVSAFGLSKSVEKTTSTGRPDSEIKNSDLSLKIDLLQLSLGFSLYFR